MMKVTHNLTPTEMGAASTLQRQQEVNQQILKCHALFRYRRAADGLEPMFGRVGSGPETQAFKTAVHKIYQRNGLVLHEFINAGATA